jgi:hypothetical protein
MMVGTFELGPVIGQTIATLTSLIIGVSVCAHAGPPINAANSAIGYFQRGRLWGGSVKRIAYVRQRSTFRIYGKCGDFLAELRVWKKRHRLSTFRQRFLASKGGLAQHIRPGNRTWLSHNGLCGANLETAGGFFSARTRQARQDRDSSADRDTRKSMKASMVGASTNTSREESTSHQV